MSLTDHDDIIPELVKAVPQEAPLPALPPLPRQPPLVLPGPITFTSNHWPPIDRLSNAERMKLADRIRKYAGPEIVRGHVLDNGAHAGSYMASVVVPGMASKGLHGKGRDFFLWHRDFLGKLQDYLGTSDCIEKEFPSTPVVAGAGAPPTPVRVDGPRQLHSWRPWEELPAELLSPPHLRGHVVPPCPAFSDADMLRYNDELVGYFDDLDGMGFIASWHWHFWVHYNCAGDMQNLDRAPNAPMFWCYHAFIDDIYEYWLTHERKTEPPAEWPWPGAKPSVWPCPPDLRSVPWLYGNTLARCKEKLEAVGLTLGEADQLCCDDDVVITQNPLPFTPVAVGSAVDTSAEMQGPFVEYPSPVQYDGDASTLTIASRNKVVAELRGLLMLELIRPGWPHVDSLPPAMSRRLSLDRSQGCDTNHGGEDEHDDAPDDDPDDDHDDG